jgi:hypothetical protein
MMGCVLSDGRLCAAAGHTTGERHRVAVALQVVAGL